MPFTFSHNETVNIVYDMLSGHRKNCLNLRFCYPLLFLSFFLSNCTTHYTRYATLFDESPVQGTRARAANVEIFIVEMIIAEIAIENNWIKLPTGSIRDRAGFYQNPRNIFFAYGSPDSVENGMMIAFVEFDRIGRECTPGQNRFYYHIFFIYHQKSSADRELVARIKEKIKSEMQKSFGENGISHIRNFTPYKDDCIRVPRHTVITDLPAVP